MSPDSGSPDTPGTRFSDGPALGLRARFGVLVLVGFLQILFVLAVVLGLAGGSGLLDGQLRQPTAAYSVPLDKPSPAPSPTPSPTPPKPEAASAKSAPPNVAIALPSVLPAPALPAAPAAGSGKGTGSGAADAGAGTGSGDEGEGTGGGPPVHPPVKIAGDIVSARDYPESSRDRRLGHRVVVVLTVGVDGRAHGCQIQMTSPDFESDAITCRLAVERFRFLPATDRQGRPVEAPFGWEQRWFAP